jgi:hypothetical protein
MRRSPSIAPPQPDDIDIYLVLDDFGGPSAVRGVRPTRRAPLGTPSLPIWSTDNIPARYGSSPSTRRKVGRGMSQPSLPT